MTKAIYTIGHGNRSWEDFVEILCAYQIVTLVDIRSYPRSKRNPQFNGEILSEKLPGRGIRYVWEKGLGGFRKKGLGSRSPHKALTSMGFRNYADYMLGDSFKSRVDGLFEMMQKEKVCLMCAETSACQCHRSYLSDYLAARCATVIHIIDSRQNTCHTISSLARLEKGDLIYDGSGPLQLEFGFS